MEFSSSFDQGRLRVVTLVLLWFSLILALLPGTVQAQDGDPVVRAVLFYSPNCPHCHQVIEEVLPTLFKEYGEQLEIVGINLDKQEGQVYWEAVEYYSIPRGRQGVPTLLVGDRLLVGGGEIPHQFPAIIEDGLEAGGIPWPDLPGLHDLLQKATVTAAAPLTQEVDPDRTPTLTALTPTPEPSPVDLTPEPQKTSSGTDGPTLTPTAVFLEDGGEDLGPGSAADGGGFWKRAGERFLEDPTGNTAAVLVLLVMILVLIIGLGKCFRPARAEMTITGNIIPVLSVLGILVAGYLAYVEITQTPAVCGPVGHCNVVQSSKYATLFGFLPVGVLGVVGYLGIGFAWVLTRLGDRAVQRAGAWVLTGMTFLGVLFSLYLTFLEPFVIGATCAWCLTSALLITGQFWVSLDLLRQESGLSP